MTENQAKIKNEIELYYARLGRYPTITSLAKLMGKARSTMSLTVSRMVARGYLEYIGDWEQGQSRQVKTLL